MDDTTYALHDDENNIRKISNSLDDATNYLVEGMPDGLGNKLFGKPADIRIDAFKEYGWKVTIGYYTQRFEL